ncbi:MAG: ribonuclease III domain-containing protein [Clostridiales bacterium]|nr:ribonuclease III [Lachnospiraceae bacterium]MDD6618526.1 ribonuclease III domain-containing protein [Clostridiales bacterium]MDY4769738.1 ribonuclease III domain-containing protein [Lachnospiraceae bacterium]
MDESIKYLKEQFQLEDIDIRTYSPLTLAYIGDAAYEMVIRSILVMQGNCPVGAFHQRASRLVKAPTQSKMMECIEPILTEEEAHVYKRGRNAHSSTTAKNASVIEYRRATGFEAVMGYLYLKQDWKRMIDLVKVGLENGVKKI